jgi:predicted  nucleic acid-binding Zn-ribbon protein
VVVVQEKFEANLTELEQCRQLLEQRQTQASRGESTEVRRLRNKVAELEEDMAVRGAEHKRELQKFRAENSELQSDFEKAKNTAKQARARLTQTETELALARKRLQLAKQVHPLTRPRALACARVPHFMLLRVTWYAPA